MRDPIDIVKQLGELTETEVAELESLKKDLDLLIEKKVLDEEGLLKLENMLTNLNLFHRKYYWRILYLVKKNHMI